MSTWDEDNWLQLFSHSPHSSPCVGLLSSVSSFSPLLFWHVARLPKSPYNNNVTHPPPISLLISLFISPFLPSELAQRGKLADTVIFKFRRMGQSATRVVLLETCLGRRRRRVQCCSSGQLKGKHYTTTVEKYTNENSLDISHKNNQSICTYLLWIMANPRFLCQFFAKNTTSIIRRWQQ